MYFLELCKLPDRECLMQLFEMMMMQLKIKARMLNID